MRVYCTSNSEASASAFYAEDKSIVNLIINLPAKFDDYSLGWSRTSDSASCQVCLTFHYPLARSHQVIVMLSSESPLEAKMMQGELFQSHEKEQWYGLLLPNNFMDQKGCTSFRATSEEE